LIGRIDLASVAVPTVLHETVASELLDGGVDVLVEKPITATLDEAERLIGLARSKGRVLMVGHTERFNPAVEALVSEARNVRFIESHRLGAFSARSVDIDVVLDLMIHDLDVVLALVGEAAMSVDAVGVGALTNKVDIANARIRFGSGCVANFTASRISAQKIRKLRVFEPHAYYSLDYSAQQVEHWFLEAAGGDQPSIQRATLPVHTDEPLRREIEAFISAVRTRHSPPVSGEEGKRALELALRVSRSIASDAPERH
jgi:predicted dehydrogenase